MRSWIREVLPPSVYVVTFLFLYGLIEGARLLVWWHWAVPPEDNNLRYVGATLVIIAALGYGAFRVMGFHPLFRASYRQWLKTTPWHVKKPLPAGPMHLTAQDAIVLGVMSMMVVDHGMSPWRVPLVFLMSYLVTLVLALATTGAKQQAYLVGFGLGLVVNLSKNPLAAVIAALAVYAVGYVGLLRSLARFPWELSPGWDQFVTSPIATQNLNEVLQQAKLGWPFEELNPVRPTTRIGYGDAFLVSLLLAWWSWVLVSQPSRRDIQSVMQGFMANLLVIAALSRAGLYCAKHHPPISLWGRLWTGRWIVPRYDVVFVAPLIAAVLGISSAALLLTPVPPPICVAVAVFCTFLPLLALGPTYERWHLTGGHRIAPGRVNKQQFIEH